MGEFFTSVIAATHLGPLGLLKPMAKDAQYRRRDKLRWTDTNTACSKPNAKLNQSSKMMLYELSHTVYCDH